MLSGRLRCGGLPHMLTIGGIGLLSDVDGGYVVADLQVLPNKANADTPLEAQLCIFQSHSPDEWQLARPQIRHQNGQEKDLIWWSTDTVIPYGDALCYADYLRGILVANVRSDCSELHYIPLPVRVPTGKPADPELGTRGCPHMLRSVCTTKGGILKFVDVVCTTVFVAGSRSPVESYFDIRLWSLDDVSKAWKQETVLGDAELWSLQGYGDLPHVVPEFPLVSMEDPSIIYFLLRNDSDDSSGDANTWIIMVDVLNRTVRSSTQYTIVDKLSNYDGDMASRNFAANEAFIPCEFSQYLKVDDTM
ncbi:hypothetical protein ZWY2020_048407 [Hordeum vulgare]|nr:hypothetical protein ZWY2020_048407 [Hordeum vulgare]